MVKLSSKSVIECYWEKIKEGKTVDEFDLGFWYRIMFGSKYICELIYKYAYKNN